MPTFAQQVKENRTELIYLVRGEDKGRNAWYYILVEKLKLSLFLKALESDKIQLQHYGVILFSGYGDNPPSEITEKLKKQ